MNLKTYEQEVQRTIPTGFDPFSNVPNFALGLAGEAGEVADMIKKVCFHGHDLDIAKLREEVGDCLWYLTALCSVFCIDLETIMSANIEKLRKRYPDGFSEAASRNREET